MPRKKTIKTKKGKKGRKKVSAMPKRRKILKFTLKAHSCLTILVMLFYLAVGVFGGPEYLLSDVKDKYTALASTANVSVYIVGLPGKPAATAASGCAGINPYILLDWAETSDTDNYDIYRNENLLISGLLETTYQDNNVVENSSYTYYVVANGPRGSTQSDDVSETVAECQPTPTCQINTIEGTDFSGIPEIDSRTPSFTGTTNISNANIRIEINTGPIVLVNTTANLNGYWSWQVPTNLDRKLHTIQVTSTDPLNVSRFITISRQFIVEDEDDDDDDDEKKKTSAGIISSPGIIETPAVSSPPQTGTPSVSAPLEFKISVTNPDKFVYSGRNLLFDFEIKNNSYSEKNIGVKYSISDMNGNEIKKWTENLSTPVKIETLQKTAGLPKLMKSGKYKIMAKADLGSATIIGEDFFDVKERPIVNLGGGFIITYPLLLSYLGWLLFFLLILLLFFLILLTLEHHLSKKAAFHITEDFLREKGVISPRKGVLK